MEHQANLLNNGPYQLMKGERLMRMLLVSTVFLSLGCAGTTWNQYRVAGCEVPVTTASQEERSFHAALVSLADRRYEIVAADAEQSTIQASLARRVWSGRTRYYEVDWLIGVEEDGTVVLDMDTEAMPRRQYKTYLGWARKFESVFRRNRCKPIDVLREQVRTDRLIPDPRLE